MSKYQSTGQSTAKYELRQNIKPRIAPLSAAVSGALAAGSLQAATITVDSLNDGFNTGECTLRSALYAATLNGTNYGCASGDAGADTIVFSSGLSGTITLTAGTGFYFDGSTLPIGETVTIDGDNDITIQGTGDAPVFYAKYDDTADYNANIVQMAQVTITGGGGARGGGVLSYANSLQFSDVTINGNTATDAGGGVWHEPYDGTGELLMLVSEISGNSVTGAGGYGGGMGVRIPLGSNIDISGATFDSNVVADGSGGGLHLDIPDYADVDIKYSTFNNNQAKYGNGGGINADLGYAVVSLEENTFTNNDAYLSGGGLYLNEDFAIAQQAEIKLDSNEFNGNSAGGSGGAASIAVRNGGGGTIADPLKFVELELNLLENNEAGAGGGGLFLELTDTVVATFEANAFGLNTTDTAGGGGILAELTASEITLQNDFMIDNTVNTGNGGNFNVNATDSTFYASGLHVSNGSTPDGAGAGIQVSAQNSSFGLEYSTFVGNMANGCGGALRVTGTPDEVGVGHSRFIGNYGSCGGAMSLFAQSANNVLVEVKYNEMSYNQATSDAATLGGGAIFADFGSGSSVVLKNSTVSDNFSAGVGGGVRFRGDTSADIKYSTIANNYAFNDGGGVYNSVNSCSIENSILAGNQNQTGLLEDLRGSVDCNVSYSVLAGAKYSDYTDGGGNILDTDPLLVSLYDNGGNAGQTHALQPGSPAIDAGSAGSYAPSYDQRGPAYPRIQNGTIDMGAFEVGPPIDEIFSDRFEQP